ncbi:MAG: ATP-binding protein, partial [Pseudomonadales bacterium]
VLENVLDLYVPSDRFQVRLPDDLPQVFAPLAAVELVFRNIVMNSVKHHDKEQGAISVSSETADDEVIFTLSDDGPGIPAEYQEKVFRLFQTLKSRDELEGSGMGLALVKKTMEIHDGRVEILSDGKNGTSFILAWPVLPEQNHE